MNYLEQLASQVEAGQHSQVGSTIDAALKGGTPIKDIVDKGIVMGIERLGEKWKRGQAYLPEVLIAARAAHAAFQALGPALASSASLTKGKVVLGTIEGDMHDIGKDLVRLVLQADGFQVVDLGVDVPAARFLEAVTEEKPDIVGISALLTTTMTSIPDVIQALTEKGLRSRVKVMVGGAPLDGEFARQAGADAYGKDCFQAAELARAFMKSVR